MSKDTKENIIAYIIAGLVVLVFISGIMYTYYTLYSNERYITVFVSLAIIALYILKYFGFSMKWMEISIRGETYGLGTFTIIFIFCIFWYENYLKDGESTIGIAVFLSIGLIVVLFESIIKERKRRNEGKNRW